MLKNDGEAGGADEGEDEEEPAEGGGKKKKKRRKKKGGGNAQYADRFQDNSEIRKLGNWAAGDWK